MRNISNKICKYLGQYLKYMYVGIIVWISFTSFQRHNKRIGAISVLFITAHSHKDLCLACDLFNE